LLYEGNTIHNASDQFVSCVYSSFVDFVFHPFPQTKKTGLYAPTSNSCIVTPRKLGTCLYELFYSEKYLLPPPKIFTVPPEKPCIFSPHCTYCHCVLLYFRANFVCF
jgi:hypothetical protein